MMVKPLILTILMLTFTSAVMSPTHRPVPPTGVSLDAHQAFLRGNADFMSKDYRAAIADYTLCLFLGDHGPGIYYNRGLAYKKLGQPQFRQAADDFLRAIRGGETRSDNYFQLAYTRSVFDPRAALADWNLAVRLQPDDPDALYNRGQVRAQLGERRSAARDLRRAAWLYRLISDNPDAISHSRYVP